MSSGRGQYPAGAAMAAASLIAIRMLTPAHANPATVDYLCQPGLPGGDRISVDYNSGGKSITLMYPDGRSLRMPIRRSGSGFRYGGDGVEVAGKGQTTITLQVAGQPSRQCVTPR